MTWVKVCGLRTVADVEVAIDAGADAIGLVLADSPRRIDVSTAIQLIEAAQGVIETVLVTVDRTAEELLSLLEETGASGAQPYGVHAVEASAVVVASGRMVLSPVRGSVGVDLASIPSGQIPLVDNSDDRLHGGTGQPFDWALLAGEGRDFVLAGGLGPENVTEAIRQVRPWGVDASSHLESAPGVKDHHAIHDFVRRAHDG